MAASAPSRPRHRRLRAQREPHLPARFLRGRLPLRRRRDARRAGARGQAGRLDRPAGDPGLQHQSRKERSRTFVTMAEFTLPELGENVTAGDVLRVLVKPGDTLAKDQMVLELETDKATIEVPSSIAGRVTAVSVKAGDKVKVGQVVLTVEDGAGKSAAASAAAPQKAPEKAPEQASAPARDGAAGAEPSNKKPDEVPEEDVEGPKRGAPPRGTL